VRGALVALAAAGVVCLAAGFALDGWIPLVKKIWTPSFALMSGGFSLLAFVALALATNGAGAANAAWTRPVLAFGSNATAAFVGITLLDTLLQLHLLPQADGQALSLHDAAARQLGRLIPEPRIASAAYSVLLLCVLGAGLWQLYRRRIFLKL
jgi:predicted acyltransferase